MSFALVAVRAADEAGTPELGKISKNGNNWDNFEIFGRRIVPKQQQHALVEDPIGKEEEEEEELIIDEDMVDRSGRTLVNFGLFYKKPWLN